MTQYARGVRKEYELVKELREAGWHVIRAAGSHGLADVIAIDALSRDIRFYQVKYSIDGKFHDIPMLPSGKYEVLSFLRVYKRGDGYQEWPAI
jgi:hypothetical protein